MLEDLMRKVDDTKRDLDAAVAALAAATDAGGDVATAQAAVEGLKREFSDAEAALAAEKAKAPADDKPLQGEALHAKLGAGTSSAERFDEDLSPARCVALRVWGGATGEPTTLIVDVELTGRGEQVRTVRITGARQVDAQSPGLWGYSSTDVVEGQLADTVSWQREIDATLGIPMPWIEAAVSLVRAVRPILAKHLTTG